MRSKLLVAIFGLMLVGSHLSAGLYTGGCCDPCSNCGAYDKEKCPPDPCCGGCDYPCYNWFLYGDWLYWKVRRSGLDYATYGEDNELLGPGKIERVEPDYDQGFRVALYFITDERYTFGVRYTYFHNNYSNSTLRTEGDLFATRIHPAECSVEHDLNEFAHCKYKIDYDLIDAEFGYTYNFECAEGEVRPFIGGRFGFIEETVETHYDQIRTNQGLVGDLNERVCVDAYGMQLGMEGTMNVKGPFNVFFRTSAGLLFADGDSRFVEEDNSLEGAAVCVNIKDNERRVVSTFDLMIGGEILLCQSHRGTLALRAGYEFHSWYNTRDFLGFIDDVSVASLRRNNSALGFDGVFVRIHLPY